MKGQPVGNVGALPVFASVAEVPAWAVYRGVPFALAGRPDVYVATAPDGLGGWLSSLVKIGGLVAAPFTAGLSIPAAQIAGGALDAREAQGQQAKQIGAQFDQLAAQTTQLFNSIQSKAVITPADYAAAANAYNQLAGVASQYGSVSFVARKWADPSYDQAYRARLDQIKAAAQTAAGGGAASLSVSASALGDVPAVASDNTKLLLGAAAVALAFMFASR